MTATTREKPTKQPDENRWASGLFCSDITVGVPPLVRPV
jgi:hypothetical protein